MIMRYKDSPDPMPPGMIPPGWEDKVMNVSFRIGGTSVMASDGCEEGQGFAGFSLSVSLPTAADADRVLDALVAGGQVRMPMARTFWSPRFGMLTDRFGVGWMVTVTP